MEQRIAQLEKEIRNLKHQIEHDQIEVQAAKKFLYYIMNDFEKHIPDVFGMHYDRWVKQLYPNDYKPTCVEENNERNT